ncbi:MAG: ABC transporter permease, partial [Candidatus Hydrogenedentes bacterium]|nr:ABC transporter permease [Candidatus Hydrogenedentota bacterium]
MSNILSIMRRDLAAYFTSPIGYIFIMVFVTISVGLYITAFFTFPVADMRPFFENLPLLLCVFIPAVTMRIWAEER